MHENIEEFHSGKTYSRTKAKFGKQTADKQAVAAAYAKAQGQRLRAAELERLELAAYLADEMGLVLHAGHGLDYHNVRPVARIARLAALNIGFSIVARAMFVGLKSAVGEMKRLIS